MAHLFPFGEAMLERRIIRVRGLIQGVGFRPFVHRLASGLRLSGIVRNDAGEVLIEAEGDRQALDRFLEVLTEDPPCLAQIEHLSWTLCSPNGEKSFRICRSRIESVGQVIISSDVATCRDCLRELFDPRDRRYGYPFLNCTNCGPRLTIITESPYDRAQTTMAGFVLCTACRKEYEDPTDRRFHAQPVACPDCGPTLSVANSAGMSIACDDPLVEFVIRLKRHSIGAIKGLGGYHLVCDARSEAAVSELRRRKRRDEKPFAVMVPNGEAASALCEISDAELALLTSSRAPILLAQKRAGCSVARSVAPGNPFLGVMLPYTPLHHLLLSTAQIPLVMTSGNRSDEPITYLDNDARDRLRGIADVFLTHDRPIRIRCEDSVMRVVDGAEQFIRRSRGYAPEPLRLTAECPQPILAVGGQLKSTFALGHGQHAFISHHIGDLDHIEAYRAFEKDIDHYEKLFAIRPEVIVHDLHPDYASTRYALNRAAREGTTLVAVQHHHAHLASCMAENGLSDAVIGVTFDGTGYGTDGAIWGGEILVGDARECRRAAHLRYVRLPGGDRAVRQPWRIAWAQLLDAGCECESFTSRRSAIELRTVEAMVQRAYNSPPTSSMGRLFDAVACLSGGRDLVSYEAQDAIELEWLAATATGDEIYPFELVDESGDDFQMIIDTRPLIRAAVEDVATGLPRKHIARRFHFTVVEMIASVCRRLRTCTGLNTVVLTGGVFMNALLTSEATRTLTADGFRVFRHRLVPPNDGGLSLGQIAVAAAQR